MQISSFKKKLMRRSYAIAETLPIIKKVQLINMKKFAKIALNDKSKSFIMHIVILKALEMIIYPF